MIKSALQRLQWKVHTLSITYIDPLWWVDTYKIGLWWDKKRGKVKPDRERSVSEHTEIHIEAAGGEPKDGYHIFWHKGRKEFVAVNEDEIREALDTDE